MLLGLNTNNQNNTTINHRGILNNTSAVNFNLTFYPSLRGLVPPRWHIAGRYISGMLRSLGRSLKGHLRPEALKPNGNVHRR
jgi:hypothetical protein